MRKHNGQIADKATQMPFAICRVGSDDEVQIPLQPLPRTQRLVLQRLFDELPRARKIAVQDFLRKCLLGAEVIGERAERNASASQISRTLEAVYPDRNMTLRPALGRSSRSDRLLMFKSYVRTYV